MPDTAHTAQSTRSAPKYRKKLNEEQVAILDLLYKFRFASSEQIAQHSNKKNKKYVQKRLKILEDQNLIAKRYDKSYKLKGKPAAYYLLPNGVRTLIHHTPAEEGKVMNVKRIYKDKNVSENFIEHCCNVLSIYLQLKKLHDKVALEFTTRTLHDERYEYFPQPLPDAFISLRQNTQNNKQDTCFFLDIFEDNQPFFVLIRRIKNYLDYIKRGQWVAANIQQPTILMVVTNESVHKRLRKRIAKELRESYEDKVVFMTTKLDSLLNPEYEDKVWFPMDIYSDPKERNEAVLLRDS